MYYQKAAQIKTYRVHLPWRHHTKPKFKQTYTEKKVLAEQRALWRSAYDKALAEACEVMWDQAIKIQRTVWWTFYWILFPGNNARYYDFPLPHVLLVTPIIFPSYPLRLFLSKRTLSHYKWHTCWLTSTFVPYFTLQTLCPAYLNNPQLSYKYWTWSLIHSNLFLPTQ